MPRIEHANHPSRQSSRLAIALGAIVLAVGACTDGSSGNSLSDHTPPRFKLTSAAPPNDSSVAWVSDVTDNLGILRIHVTAAGPGVAAQFDTTFNSAVTAIQLPYALQIPSSIPPGTLLTVAGFATDGNHNSSLPDTLLITTGGLAAAGVVITNPINGDTAVVGFNIAVAVSGKTGAKVRALGYIATGVFPTPKRDSVLLSSPLLDSTAFNTSLDLTGATPGTMQLQPFLLDSLGRTTLGAPISVLVSATASSNTVPTVTFGLTKRIEVTDTIHVEARDRGGVRWVGYKVDTLGIAQSCAGFSVRDSAQIAGNFSSYVHTFTMGLPVTAFPCQVVVRAYAINQQGNYGWARNATGDTLIDTVTVVAGLTRTMVQGGVIADGIYHPATNRIYLTNIERNELEVFDLADSTFKTPIIVGSRPWGIAAWPRNRDGTMGDTLLIANSGGTTIGYVDLTQGANGLEVFRYALPNIIPQTVTSTLAATGQIIQQHTLYDFSDRPQYLASLCRAPAVGPAACGAVILVYSTTPTPGQPAPFPNAGTVRWEDLTNAQSHFFFEQATLQEQGRSDSLQIDRNAAQGVGADSVLVPFIQTGTGGDTTKFSTVVTIRKLGFRDTTFVRGSGNFRQAIIAEGGPVVNSRAMTYDVTRGFQLTFGGTHTLQVPVFDNGASRPTDVTDFIANTSTRVAGAAINFDGALSAIRGDSTYIIDRTLRLQGLLQTSGGNPGFDFHPQNTGIGPAATGGAGSRVGFAASSSPQIDVYDTYTYRRCLIVPTRDAIVGPIKSARLAGPGGDVALVGATQSGIVIVTIKAAQLTACS